jgi:glutathione synthase/RimK-type ligase-like ATP-grasp enzyme
MRTLFVVDRRTDWPHATRGATIATADEYLTGEGVSAGVERVVNLCRCDRVHGPGFFVSLLAEARGQAPLPAARIIEDLRGTVAAVPALKGFQAERLAADASRLILHAYFGRDAEGRHDAAAGRLFSLLQAPLLRAELHNDGGFWRVQRVRALSLAEVPPAHGQALARAAAEFAADRAQPRAGRRGPAAIAILRTPGEPLPPSNPAALDKLLAAAAALGMRAEIIDRSAVGRLAEFDALFIRDTTYLDHYTYEFSQRAASLGLVVIDDADSILHCNNKVYLHELLTRHGIPVPRTLLVHRGNVGEVVRTLGLPCVLKQPDGGFSLGVCRARSAQELEREACRLLEKSELIIAQEFVATEFDWRVTVLDRRPLFVCRYFMAPGHWQIHKYEPGRHLEGASQALSVGEAPHVVVQTALRAANLIGAGLYGVDLKQAGDRCVVMEINDNPSIEAGNEDDVLRDALYREIMGVFLRRITEARAALAA